MHWVVQTVAITDLEEHEKRLCLDFVMVREIMPALALC